MLDVSEENLDLLIKSKVAAELLAKRVGEHLHAKYPGYLWAVNVGGGVVTVQNLHLSGKWGFRVFERDITPDMREITAAGGELLERYNLRRAGIDRDAVASLERNLRGDALGDTSL